MGSFWAPRTAAFDSRVAACAAGSANFEDKNFIFDVASPRFKQIFMYMAGAKDEDAFDKMAMQMTLKGYGSRIRCPVLMAAGEFDPLCPVEDAFSFFEELNVPKELWVLENEFHRVWGMKGLGGMDLNPMAVDWLRDALTDKIPPGHDKTAYVQQNSKSGPFGAQFPENHPRKW